MPIETVDIVQVSLKVMKRLIRFPYIPKINLPILQATRYVLLPLPIVLDELDIIDIFETHHLLVNTVVPQCDAPA